MLNKRINLLDKKKKIENFETKYTKNSNMQNKKYIYYK